MRKKTIIFLIVFLVLGVSFFSIEAVRRAKMRSYQAGLRAGQNEELKWKLAMSTGFYQALEEGNYSKVKREIGVIVFATTKEYESVFPVEVKSNNWPYSACKKISASVISNLVLIDEKKLVEEANKQISQENQKK